MAYQDVWIRGGVQQAGQRDCASRYEPIRSVVAEYRRPITLWDVGANLGYFGLRIADEFGAVSVMVDRRPALVDICAQNDLPTTIALTHALTGRDLVELAQSEHADVVLCLNVLHHMADWAPALEAVLALGEEVVIETPGRGDRGSAHYDRSQAILDALEAKRPAVIAWIPSHVTPGVRRPMYRFSQSKAALTSGYAYRERVRKKGPHPVRPHVITSTKTIKTVQFVHEAARAWHPGLNLWNWAQLQGAYPDRPAVQASIASAAAALGQRHGDFRPWNLILQGRAVQVIDSQHRLSTPDAQGLSDTLAWVARPELAYAS